MFKKHAIILLFILFLASILRLYQLENIPSGFHSDEAALGYNAYSILETGKDEYGKSFPVTIRSFDDYKPALYAYFDIPFIKIFDLTPFAVRLPSVIASILTIVIIYFFTRKILKNNNIALITVFLIAISPWHIMLSRTTGEFNIALLFTMIMSYILLLLREKFSLFLIFLAIITGSFSIISYTASRFFIILLICLFILFSVSRTRNRFNFPNFNKSIFIVLITIVIFGFVYNFIDSANRFKQIDIFSNPATKLTLEEQIREDQFLPSYQTRLLHNKVINYSRTILKNYGEYFTLDFLFLNGGYPFRERIPDVGLLYLWQIAFLLIGIFTVVYRKRKEEIFLFLWWAVLLLPLALTFDEIPNVHRSLIVLPPIIIIIAIGLFYFFQYKWIKKTKIISIILLIFIIFIGSFEFFYFLHQYFRHQAVHKPWYRGYAYKELISELKNYYGNYKKIVITKGNSNAYIYVLFYNKYDPNKYQLTGSHRDEDNKGFDKYIFSPYDCPLSAGEKGLDPIRGEAGVLYVNKGDCLLPKYDVKLLKTIKWKDGSSAFKLAEYRPK